MLTYRRLVSCKTFILWSSCKWLLSNRKHPWWWLIVLQGINHVYSPFQSHSGVLLFNDHIYALVSCIFLCTIFVILLFPLLTESMDFWQMFTIYLYLFKNYALTEQLSRSARSLWWGTSPLVQRLRLHAPNAGGLGSIPGQGTRSCMHASTKSPCATAKTQRSQINKFFFLKGSLWWLN